MNKIIVISVLMLSIISCSEENIEPPKNEYEIKWEKTKKLDSSNSQQALQIANKHDALFGWDTTLNFTYTLQEKFENSSYPVAFIGEIMDVIKVDSSYILKVASTNKVWYPAYIAEITVNSILFQNLKSQFDPKVSNEGCFIFNTTNITSHQPVLKSEIDRDGQYVEDASSYLMLDFEHDLVKFKGKLIDYYMYERLKKEDE